LVYGDEHWKSHERCCRRMPLDGALQVTPQAPQLPTSVRVLIRNR
jgi:hypothetical protein